MKNFRLFNKLFSVGTQPAYSTLTNKYIVLCNKLSLLCISLTVFFIAYYYSIRQTEMVQIECAFLLIYTLPLFFNYYNLIVAARVYFNVIILLHLFLLSALLGPRSNMYVFFVPTVMAPFVLFEFSQRKILVLLSLFNVSLVSILYAYIFRNYYSPIHLSTEETDILNKIIFYTAIFCCIAIIYSILYVNEKTTRQLDRDKGTLALQLEAIFENSNDAKFLVNMQNQTIVKANGRAAQLFEATAPHDVFDKYSFAFRKNPPTKEEIEKIHQTIQEKGFYEDEILYKTFKGGEFWGSVYVRPLEIDGTKYQSIRLTDISDQKRSKQRVETELKEKELLLAEIHHRVKNNLAIISALINLQIENLKDEESKTIFEETKDRIHSMALIHNQLYQNNSFAHIEFAQYINNFCSYVTKSYQTDLNVEVIERTEKIQLDIKTAIPCALILNELITNSFKHAFKNQAKGQIEVGLKKENGHTLFWVSDSGSGMENQQLQASSMGMSLVTSLVEQIDGKLDYQKENGSKFLIRF